MPTRAQNTKDNLTSLNEITNQLQTKIASHDASIAELLQSSQDTNNELQSTKTQLASVTSKMNEILTHLGLTRLIEDKLSSQQMYPPLQKPYYRPTPITNHTVVTASPSIPAP